MADKKKNEADQSGPQTGTRNDSGITRDEDGPATNSPVADAVDTAADTDADADVSEEE